LTSERYAAGSIDDIIAVHASAHARQAWAHMRQVSLIDAWSLHSSAQAMHIVMHA